MPLIAARFPSKEKELRDAGPVEPVLIPHSGRSGVSIHLAYPGDDPRSEKSIFDIILAPKDKASWQLDRVYELLKDEPGFAGCILDGQRDVVGGRIAQGSDHKANLCKAFGVHFTPNNSLRYRTPMLPLHPSTKGQVQKILDGDISKLQWPEAVCQFVP